MGLSSLPTHILLMSISKIRKALLQAATSTSAKDKFWAEARRDVIGALAQITTNLFTNDPTNGSCSEENLLCLFNCFMLSLEDYTIDARGDIGTVVREAGMKALKKLAELVGKKSDIVTQFLSDDNRFFTMSLKILNQACEKIDRTRVIAAEVLRFFLVSPQFHQFPIPHRNSLHSIFQPEDVDTDGNMVNWSSATFSYSRLAQLLYYPEYIYDVLLGFIVSAGDSTESTSKVS